MASTAAGIRVLVVEDERWVRESLRFMLGESVAACCATAHEALRELADGTPIDVALVDLGLPDMRGAELIRRIHQARPGVATVVFTVFDDEPSILEAIRAGAQGYLLKNAPAERVIAGLRDAVSGGAPMTPAIARMVLDALRAHQLEEKPNDECFHLLTEREREVLALLAKGLTYGETAETLNIGLGTVQGYVKRLYGKLQISSKAEAATLAQRMGLV
ncbi:MAG: response regulator transcription factor [Polyangiaceae bacterium]